MISCHARGTSTRNRVTGAQVLGECELLLVSVTGISKPGNTREYPGNLQKGDTSTTETQNKRSSSMKQWASGRCFQLPRQHHYPNCSSNVVPVAILTPCGLYARAAFEAQSSLKNKILRTIARATQASHAACKCEF